MLRIGYNNLSHKDHPEDVAKGIHEIIKAIKSKIAHVKVLLANILPSGHHNSAIHATNKLLPKEADNKTVFHLDMTKHYESSPGHINTTLFIEDKLHMTEAGYKVWYKAMEPLFAKLIA